MKFFSWVQNTLNGSQENRKTKTVPVPATHHTKREPPKEEFNDWPHGLLAIGTFGNPGVKENNDIITENSEIQENINQNSPSSSEDDLSDFTPEEVGQLQKELKKLLRKKPALKSEGENSDLPLDRFLNCPSSLEVSRRISTTVCSEIDEREDDIDRTIRVIIDRCKDVFMEKNKKAIGKKSISFLLKKMFVCKSGFAPAPSLRDTFQETRMEKLLRTMLSKKIYPQNASRASSMKKYLEDGQSRTDKEEDHTREKANKGSKWDKTDSEYIVLEI